MKFIGPDDVNMKDQFSCDKCGLGLEQKIVVMDGVSPGLQRRYLSWKKSLGEQDY